MLSLDADDLILYYGDGTNLVAIGGGLEVVNELHVNYVAAATAFAEFSALDIQLNVGSLASTSLVHALNIAATGSTSGEIVGLGTHTGVMPVLQHIGTFQSIDQATPDAYAGEYPSGGSFDDGIDGKTLFEAVNDEIYIGAAAVFSELEVILSTPCSKDENLIFEYQHTDTTWDAFVPEDGTEGFEQNGIIEWPTLTSWKSNSDPGGGAGAIGYWIRIRRTRSGSATDPIATTIKTLNPTTYKWDELGNATFNSVITGLVDADGAVDLDFGSADITDMLFQTDGTGDGEIVFPDDSVGVAEINWAAIASTELSDTANLMYNDDPRIIFEKTLVDPNALYDIDQQFVLAYIGEEAPNGVTITAIRIETDNPSYEITGILGYADDFQAGANAVAIDTITTSGGKIVITSGFDDATVPNGKTIYLVLSADPNAAMKQFRITVWGTSD